MARESMEETEDVVTVPVPTASVADFETALKFAYTRVGKLALWSTVSGVCFAFQVAAA